MSTGNTHSQAEDGMAMKTSRFLEQLVEEHRNDAPINVQADTRSQRLNFEAAVWGRSPASR